MIIDENLIFISLITVFMVFIINKQPYILGIICLILIFYYFYKGRFTNPKEFLSFIKKKTIDAFEPCNSSNMSYCGSDASNSNLTFIPDIIRSALPNNSINSIGSVMLKADDYKIDRRLKIEGPISIDEIISTVPPLLDYKIYLETVINFVISINTDDIIQKDFLAKKLQNKMTKLFYNAYNTVTSKHYPINIYNELLYSEREFDETLNIFIFLGLNMTTENELILLQKEFKMLNDKLNNYVIEKVNDILPNDYDITTSFLPHINEPVGINIFDNIFNN